MTDSVKGALLTMFGGMCWGVSGCVGQYLFTRQGMDSTWLVPIRLFLAGVILCIYYGVRNWRQLVNPWRSWRNARDLVIYGLAGVSFCQFTYFLTIQLSSAGVGTILQDLSPVLILLVVCIQQKRAPRLFEVFSIVLALGGVFMLTTHGSLTNMAVSPAALVVGIISAFCVVIYTIWPQNLQKQYPTPMLQGWAFLMGGTFFALVFRPWRMNYVPNAAGIAGIAAVVLIGNVLAAMGVFGIFIVVVLGNVLAFSLYMSGVPLIGPQKARLYSFAEPVTAAIISTLVLGSPFTVWDAIGFVCIFLMLVLLFISNEKQAKSAASA